MAARAGWLWGVLVLQAACVPGARWEPSMGRGVPSHYAQSMNSAVDGCGRNPACAVTAPGEEALVPGVSRVVTPPNAVLIPGRAALTDAQVRHIEKVLTECAREADAQVNEKEYGPGRFPDDAECNRLVRDAKGRESTRAAELGTLKHTVAFACVRRRLAEFSDSLSIEPRYGKEPVNGKYVLSQQWGKSFKPDIVLHAPGNPEQAQCVYDFKFPCLSSRKSNPLGEDEQDQLEFYDRMMLQCPPAIVTPQLGVSHE